MRHHPSNQAPSSRSGFILVAVLILVVVLSLAAYHFNDLMMAEYQAADSYERSTQARVFADSGIHYAAALLSNSDAFSTSPLNSNPFDNALAFSGVAVNPAARMRFQGRFSFVAPMDPDDPNASGQGFRFGVIDESGKINLNALLQIDSSGRVAHDMLMALPNMTQEIADAILDWLDPDDEPRANGAENSYYQALS